MPEQWFDQEFSVPSNLWMADQLSLAVGRLVTSTSNAETLFRSVFSCLAGERGWQIAELSWIGNHSVHSRLLMLQRAVNGSELPPDRKNECLALISRFDRVLTSRNFYSHAQVILDPETGEPQVIEGYKLTNDQSLIKFKTKEVNKATINEIVQSVRNCENLSRECFGFVSRLAKYLGVEDRFSATSPNVPTGYIKER